MIGLATGRIISFLLDGIPSISFTVGFALELTLGLWGIINLKKDKDSDNVLNRIEPLNRDQDFN